MSSARNMDSRFAGIRVISSIAIGCLLLAPHYGWSQGDTSSGVRIHPLPTTKASDAPSSTGETDKKTGQKPSGMSGGEKAGIFAGIFAAAVATAIVVHQHEHKMPSSDDLMKNGPQVPQNVLMNHLIVDGLIGPDWPVGLDFQIEGPGSVTLDITTADKVQYHQVLTNDLNGRGITVTRPDGLPDKLQAATFDVEAIAPAGSNGPPPNLRLYGMAAGPYVVHSIAIDQVTFGPASVRMKQEAQFGFHSHSDFSNVRADFMFTGLKDNHIVMRQDNETPLGPVTQNEHAQGSLQGKGTEGQHLLQIRAWRGNTGDWVVAWSPDVVTLAK
jgi:hypothetical protein